MYIYKQVEKYNQIYKMSDKNTVKKEDSYHGKVSDVHRSLVKDEDIKEKWFCGRYFGEYGDVFLNYRFSENKRRGCYAVSVT